MPSLVVPGLYVDLGAWHYNVFRLEPHRTWKDSVRDTIGGPPLCEYLTGVCPDAIRTRERASDDFGKIGGCPDGLVFFRTFVSERSHGGASAGAFAAFVDAVVDTKRQTRA
jgi:hypothetical protein